MGHVASSGGSKDKLTYGLPVGIHIPFPRRFSGQQMVVSSTCWIPPHLCGCSKGKGSYSNTWLILFSTLRSDLARLTLPEEAGRSRGARSGSFSGKSCINLLIVSSFWKCCFRKESLTIEGRVEVSLSPLPVPDLFHLPVNQPQGAYKVAPCGGHYEGFVPRQRVEARPGSVVVVWSASGDCRGARCGGTVSTL